MVFDCITIIYALMVLLVTMLVKITTLYDLTIVIHFCTAPFIVKVVIREPPYLTQHGKSAGTAFLRQPLQQDG